MGGFFFPFVAVGFANRSWVTIEGARLADGTGDAMAWRDVGGGVGVWGCGGVFRD